MSMLSSYRRFQLAWVVGGLLAWGNLAAIYAQDNAEAQHATQSWDDVIARGRTFVETLRPELRQKATFEFSTDERLNWHFIPRDRQGLTLKEMNVDERRSAHDLLRSVLSSQGYLKATSVMSLEAILREQEGPGAEERRDQEKYYFSVFGTPSGDEPWGFRVEGHHLSLNFSSVHGVVVSSAPMFYGANPAEVRGGPRAGLRVLAQEEDLARELVLSLTEEQRKEAIFDVEAPRDIILVPGHEIDLGKPVGVAAADMNKAQAALLRRLIALYAHDLRHDLAEQELAQLNDGNFEQVRFAWAGSVERGQGHYYRVHAPTFIIEYDNTQNDANHIHSVWHSINDNFARDTLRKHYDEHKHE